MEKTTPIEPKRYFGVTISSTFKDLVEHRAALIKAINAYDMKDVAMENSTAKLIDVIDSSLQMVRDGAAYINVIGHKYGQVIESKEKNPDNLSITEIEFNEALVLHRPTLLFLMDEDHPVTKKDIEIDPDKIKKLEAFKKRAKEMGHGSKIPRVYATFKSVDDLNVKIGPALAEVKTYLEKLPPVDHHPPVTAVSHSPTNPIPKPPELYAAPPYIGSHNFVGRQSELDAISDWAQPANAHSVLLFEAIGGNGKSMLTWEWATKHAPTTRKDWAGVFWYSFYETGARMAEFCQHALAYITGRPLEDFRKKKTPELSDELIPLLKSNPWLFVLDGLERVLVAYHRIDAAEVRDEELNKPTDKIVNRDPCICTNVEDDELLHLLSTVSLSKILISSRLMPRVLFNNASQPIPGVMRVTLNGLRPVDAEIFFKACGVSGNSETIQSYLITNCDCHPLTVGILAGLINNYLPARGDFDAWEFNSLGGGSLNLAELDLVGKRNHILKAAMYALLPASRQLLSTLSLLSEAVDYTTLTAFNPHSPPGLKDVEDPKNPEAEWFWKDLTPQYKRDARFKYQEELEKHQQALLRWHGTKEYVEGIKKLNETITDLEQRGLLQYDKNTRRYDLHPVVRGVAAGGLQAKEKERYGRQVVDHFTSKVHNPYEKAETIADVSSGINIIRTLLKIGEYKEAFNVFVELAIPLYYNLEGSTQILALTRPFFTSGWATMPKGLNKEDGSWLLNGVANALGEVHAYEEALTVREMHIAPVLDGGRLSEISISLSNLEGDLINSNYLAVSKRAQDLNSQITNLSNDKSVQFRYIVDTFLSYNRYQLWSEAEETWRHMESMGRNFDTAFYLPGNAEYYYARFRFTKGDLEEDLLARAEKLAIEGKNRSALRNLLELRGLWHLQNGTWQLAVDSLNEAVRMSRISAIPNAEAETWLALSKFHLGQLLQPEIEAERLTQAREPDHRALAELWLAIGNKNEAEKHALLAYKEAWADGEPFVNRYELTKTSELLNRLNVAVPNLPVYDPAKDVKRPWEDKVEKFIAKLKKEEKIKNKKG